MINLKFETNIIVRAKDVFNFLFTLHLLLFTIIFNRFSDSDSEFNDNRKRRRSSCLPMPTIKLKFKFRKPQWRKRCLAITNLITIYVILWLCWSPLIVEYIIDINDIRPAYVYYVEATFMYLNSAFNVVLYSLMNNAFRKAHRRFFRPRFKRFYTGSTPQY